MSSAESELRRESSWAWVGPLDPDAINPKTTWIKGGEKTRLIGILVLPGIGKPSVWFLNNLFIPNPTSVGIKKYKQYIMYHDQLLYNINLLNHVIRLRVKQVSWMFLHLVKGQGIRRMRERDIERNSILYL